MRLPLGILSGMGFIGAGAILRRGNPVRGVTTAATATGTAASDVLSNARELDNQSGMLRNAVDGFLAKVRAA